MKNSLSFNIEKSKWHSVRVTNALLVLLTSPKVAVSYYSLAIARVKQIQKIRTDDYLILLVVRFILFLNAYLTSAMRIIESSTVIISSIKNQQNIRTHYFILFDTSKFWSCSIFTLKFAELFIVFFSIF